jgi:transposase
MKVSTRKCVFLSDLQKHEIIQEVLSGRISKEGARRKYDIRGKSAILEWMRSFGYEMTSGSCDSTMAKNKADQIREELPDDPVVLKRRIEQLERELKLAQLDAMAQSTMIDIAEKTFKIPIRKKSVTK